jgi:hypothetical protein
VFRVTFASGTDEVVEDLPPHVVINAELAGLIKKTSS